MIISFSFGDGPREARELRYTLAFSPSPRIGSEIAGAGGGVSVATAAPVVSAFQWPCFFFFPSMMSRLRLSPRLLCALFFFPIAIRSESYASFDGASASSAYSTSFSADLALAAGSGYWCRSRTLFPALPFARVFRFAVREVMARARALLGQAFLTSDARPWA